MDGRTEAERAELRRLADDDDERAEELAEGQPGYAEYLERRAEFRRWLAND